MPWCQLKHLPTMKSVLQVILTMLLATSCSIYKQYPLEEEYNQSWKGRSYGEIVAEFGAPDRVEYDGIDGRILVYEEFISTAKTEIDTHFGRFDPDSKTTVKTDRQYVHFFIDSENICYMVKSNRMRTDPQSQKKAMITIGVASGVSACICGLLAIIIPKSMARRAGF